MFNEVRNKAAVSVFMLTALVVSPDKVVFAEQINTADVSTVQATPSAQLFANVGGELITVDEYNQSYQRAVRQKYYHGKPPEGELAAVRKAVADELIMRYLLLQEAKLRGFKPDEASINKTLEQYEQRYAGSEHWKQHRESLLEILRKQLSDEDMLQQLQRSVRNIPPPTDAQLRKYYEQNLEKFTEPMRQKLSLILLAVDPSSPKEVWDAAMNEARSLVVKLRNGANFAELAHLHSADISAQQGGDMGYVHREMLSEAAQKVVDELGPGEISDAIRVLQGVAILRLDDRKPEQLRAFSDVAERARGLWLRDRSESAWAVLKDKLRLDTPVTVYHNVYNGGNDV